MGNLQNLLKEVDSLLNKSDSHAKTPSIEHQNEDDKLLNALKEYFNYDSFRDGQREIIEAILNGDNVFAIYPTGHGKSICYQLPALMLPGLTVVISPLISLMKDQVDTLRANGIESVAVLNSTQTWEEYRDEINRLKQNKIKLLYISPERLRSRRFLDLLNSVRISLLVVDEVHCISQWGRDFRPAYLTICDAIDILYPQVIALFTATAPPDIQEDVLSILNIPEPRVMTEGIERTNLKLSVQKSKEKDEKYALLKESIELLDGKGIIYAGRRKDTEEITEFLQDLGYNADYYHAGRDPHQRKLIQEAFFDDTKNGLDIVVATNAFGMGIDKQNIRFIIHWTMTGTLEEYCQEVGRAGRDGKDSQCVLFYYNEDRDLHEYFIKESAPDKKSLLKLLKALENYKGTENYRLIRMEELEWEVGFKQIKIQVCLAYLEKLNFVKRWHNVPSQIAVNFRTNTNDAAPINSDFYTQLQQRRTTDILSFCKELELSPRWVMEQLAELQNEGHIQYWGRDDLMLIELLQDSELFASISEEQMGLGDFVRYKRSRIDKMVYYAGADECRMKVIREYFGEVVAIDYQCGNCDFCLDNAG